MAKLNISKYELVIEYQSPYSKGTMVVDSNFYEKNIKKFERRFKDCVILSLIQREKEFTSYL